MTRKLLSVQIRCLGVDAMLDFEFSPNEECLSSEVQVLTVSGVTKATQL